MRVFQETNCVREQEKGKGGGGNRPSPQTLLETHILCKQLFPISPSPNTEIRGLAQWAVGDHKVT